ncbi:Glutamate-1-semialdehyde 2,1-aminomutase [Gimesia alba]|uniref:Glutamate-1-semialdehyde 2,1-aminomutase n=1 Tax=Gimesia alba TaxID=2527973 RepID=A0A517RJX8_9PLAN|nr:aspartate aminotransferase family protein [Gimesia alba]QDT44152.1 Glutamate-1-semialdehyde 2,1-aminomutase [Gimesia alba]
MSQAVGQKIEADFYAKFPTSAQDYKKACELFPSGVTHDGRYMKPFPIYVDRALDAHKYDVDGNDIIDYWSGHGALILGHSHPDMVKAVQDQVARGTHFGACHEMELEWGDLVRQLVPSCEMLRFTSSGTEATMMALRVARIATGKTKVVKFAGHFHGWHDLLTQASEPPHDDKTYAMPGVTNGVSDELVIIRPNDLDLVESTIAEHDPACIIIEATGSRWGVVPLEDGFLQGLRKLTADKGVLMIMDEVISGFRVAPGGMQEVCGIVPDLTSLAKIVAGGLPGGCLAGRADLMQAIAFDNPFGQKMKHPGTYNANPLSAAAGIAVLKQVATGEPCRKANESAAKLRKGMNEVLTRKNVNWVVYGQFSIIKVFPGYDGPRPTDDSFVPYNNDFDRLDRKHDAQLGHAFRCALLLNGVDWFGWGAMLTSAHTDEDIDFTVKAFEGAIDALRNDGFID